MNVNAPSLAILLAGQDKNSLFQSIIKKPAAAANIVHKAMSSKEAAEKQEFATKGFVDREMSLFKKAVADAGSLKEALAEPVVHKTLSKVYEVNILKQNADRFADLASSDPTDKGSEVSRSRDRGLIKLAIHLDKSTDGLGLLRNEEFQSAIRQDMAAIRFEEKAKNINPAAADAFYFERKAPGITRGMDVLANATLRDVVFGALKIPDHYKNKSIDAQLAQLDKKLDYDKLKDPEFVKQMSVDYLNQVTSKEMLKKPGLAALLNPSGQSSLFDFLA